MTMETSRRNFLAAAAATVGTVATTPLALAADKFGRDRDWTGDTTVTYPEPAWEVRDKRFAGVQGNATLQRIWHGMGNDRALWCEGPVWMGDWGSLVWSDIPNHRTLRWIEDDGHVSVFQTDSGYSIGQTRVFFSRRRRHTRLVSDWSSDVCSSDLAEINRHTPVLVAGSKILVAVAIEVGYGNVLRAVDRLAAVVRYCYARVADREAGSSQCAQVKIGRASCRERG